MIWRRVVLWNENNTSQEPALPNLLFYTEDGSRIFFEALVALYQYAHRQHPSRRQFMDVCFFPSVLLHLLVFFLLSLTDYMFFCLLSLRRFNLFFVSFLGAFEKLWGATIGFVMSVFRSVFPSICLSVRRSFRMEQLCSHWMDFHEIWYVHFENLSRKFKFDWIMTR